MTTATAPTAAAAPPRARSARRMPLGSHLREARRRLLVAAIAVAAGVVAGWFLADGVLDVLRAPITALADSREASLNYDSVGGAFELRMRVALLTGVVLAAPAWLHQVFAFVLPGLTRRERRYSVGFTLAALPLFLAGCATGLAVFPHMVELLAGFAPDDDTSILQASDYVDFVLKLVVAVGVAFVLPVFVVLLNLAGVLPAARLRAGWRWIVLAIVLFSALATPAADVVSMLLLAVPMTGLFAAAAVIAHLHDRALARRAAI
ncbi:twin-arginine translocase subunit TatC [Cnuibacter sp. UC19_7]|uniref:twin-arginine translocase subunit TatC n=1 Tax=Cnuibacter sp. UC19_7 TaxID=3350166 RepID=UPI00366FF228